MKLTLRQWILIILTSFLSLSMSIYTRSIYRPSEKNIPSIAIYDSKKRLCSTISHSHLEKYPHFVLNAERFKKYMMPPVIAYRNQPSRFITRRKMNSMIEQLIDEINQGKKGFTHFNLLKSKNFNFHHRCGLLVLKCKNHPFVIKLFTERPETYFNPYCKGIESIAFFFMGGGANRHICGLSRLPNLEILKKKLESLPQWKDIVQFPRKWFWMPKKPLFMTLKGKHFQNNNSIITNKVPETFAIIADEIQYTQTTCVEKSRKIRTIITLCNDLDTFLDAHYDNFIFKKNDTHPFTINIIDTEHIPTMAGLKKRQSFGNYWQWYSNLVAHCFKKMFLRTKRRRVMDQCTPNELALT